MEVQGPQTSNAHLNLDKTHASVLVSPIGISLTSGHPVKPVIITDTESPESLMEWGLRVGFHLIF